MMFFGGRKKEKDELPVIGSSKKPPVPPKRNKLFSTQKSEEDATANNHEAHSFQQLSHNEVPIKVQAIAGYTSNNGHSTQSYRDDTSAHLRSTQNDAALVSPSQPHASAAFGALKDFGLPGLKLPILQSVQVKQRTLTIRRGVNGDFGFLIRRAQYPQHGVLKTVVFVEPAEIKPGPPRPDDIKNSLLPGDQLVEINGRGVDSLSRDELNEMIRQAAQDIVLTVRSVPELAEFSDRHRGVRDAGDSLLLTNIDTNAHENIPEDQRYWLIHKDGYTVARLQEQFPDGRFAVSVAGRTMTVDSTDIDRANPSKLDRAPDLSNLRYLNETGVVHLLRQRWGSNLTHTNAGSNSLICLSFAQEPGVQERLLTLFKGCRRGQMPPHIYATAQQVYRYVQMTGAAQAVLFTGVTGSGKSSQFKSFIQYLASVAGWTRSLSLSKISSALGVLEAFGHASTHLHRDSTRFLHMFQLGFDKAAALRCAKIQCCLLDTDRIARNIEGENNFHVFYYLWEGADSTLRSRLGLDSIESPLINPFHEIEDREQAKEAWQRLLAAFAELGFTNLQVDAICSVLGVIFHLCRAEASPGPAQRAQFLRAAHAKQAANLLGISENELSNAVFRQGTSASVAAAVGSSLSRFSLTSRSAEGPDALGSFCATLYSELFGVIVDSINGALSANVPCTYVTLVDLPGTNFNAAWIDGPKRRASNLNDLVYNYVNERVAELFHDKNFAEMDEIYTREQVEVEVDKPVGSPHLLNRLLDEKQHLANCTDLERRAEERRGIFSIIEEESCFPGATDDSLIERVFMHLGDQARLIRRSNRQRQFVLAHGLDSQPTTYDVTDWIRQSQPSDPSIGLRKLLFSSASQEIRSLFTSNGSTAIDSNLKLRRATQSVTSLETSGLLRRRDHGFAANLTYQLDYVFSLLRRSPRSHFVHCIQPTPNTLSNSLMLGLSDPVDVPFVRSQLRSLLLIDSVRANNRGYPERVSFRDFRRRFGCLIEESRGDDTIDDAIDDRAAVQKIMEKMDIHQHRYRLGISQVLLRAEILGELEDRRDLSLSGLILSFQRECRRHLAARWLHKRRVLETAIRCIQKNGLSYMKVREWNWWRIYTRVLPLLPVNRVDDAHKEWAERVQKLEHMLAEMRKEKYRLESRCSELDEALGRESDSAVQMRQELEREKQQRVVVERKLADEDRISRVSSVANLESVAALEVKEREYKAEVERAQEELENQRVKTQKTVQQLAEIRAEMEELNARNASLEKKQSRFDEEMNSQQLHLEEQKRTRERADREKDEAVQNLTRRKVEIDELKAENQELRTSASRLRREIEETQEKGQATDVVELTQLRKAKRDFEAKIHDQEEELDDLAGQRQLLQQNVTRLEMQLERIKNDQSRDSTARDTETEELRAQYQRRVRAFEDQIADLQDTNAGLLKQNRAFEQRMRNFDSQSVSFELSGGHYKRELRKALALLADTQAVLAHERENNGGQALIRQLREQLEDAEAAKLSALKGRHGLESELNELHTQIEQLLAAKSAAEEKVLALMRERNRGLAIIDDRDEELQQLLKKYKEAVQQGHIDGISIADYVEQIADLERSKQKLTEQLNEKTSQLEFLEQHTVERHKLILAEQKAEHLEAKLDLEIVIRQRLESNINRLTDELESLTEKLSEASSARDREIENVKKVRKELVVSQESVEMIKKRDTEIHHRLKQQRDENETLEEKLRQAQSEVKASAKRIEALQAALADGLADSDQNLSIVEEEVEDFEHDGSKLINHIEESPNGMNIL
ncbi:unnamed protein product, partial [Mesorhabditis belari]|uniref:Unconventional myosin-XVIIIa n=1 Tax=Mesorhabditis belari TaxID=2138241 RepID=A0AAF3FBH7_9BILA